MKKHEKVIEKMMKDHKQYLAGLHFKTELAFPDIDNEMMCRIKQHTFTTVRDILHGIYEGIRKA